MEREYNIIHKWLDVDGKDKLQSVLTTKEFGNICSEIINGTASDKINNDLLDSLDNEVMNEYDFRLSKL